MANELNAEKKTMAVSMLAEGKGNSIRSLERMTGSHADGKNDEDERFVAVLEIPPVDSDQKAVQVQIVKDVKENK